MSREIQETQMSLGESSIASIQFDIKSRDDIPKILKGLQYIYVTKSVRDPVFALLEEKILPEVDKTNGRPGMTLWKLLVMGVLRLDLNCDYDRLQELVNQHKSVRQLLGHADVVDDYHYKLQTIKDNVRLLTPALLGEINELIVKAGHGLLSKKKESEALRGRCDSFVVETDVHYPTDINLLYDAVRKVIQLTAQLCTKHQFSDFRQHAYNVKQVKRCMRVAQQKKRTSGKTAEQKARCEQAMKQAHGDLLQLSQAFLSKASNCLDKIAAAGPISISDLALIDSIHAFEHHAKRQIEQITRRVLQGEVIGHEEKVFSLFQPHTEWICKGKAGVPVELGLRVCVMEDQHQFILHHRVMEKEADHQVAVPMVRETKAAFPHMSSCSFDKGFHSPDNQQNLTEYLEVVALKRKGKPSQKTKVIESSESFKKAAHKHSAIESAINALEVHGLDKCPDHGITGFKRYVALAVVARNIHRIGAILQQREQKQYRRQVRCREGTLSLAA